MKASGAATSKGSTAAAKSAPARKKAAAAADGARSSLSVQLRGRRRPRAAAADEDGRDAAAASSSSSPELQLQQHGGGADEAAGYTAEVMAAAMFIVIVHRTSWSEAVRRSSVSLPMRTLQRRVALFLRDRGYALREDIPDAVLAQMTEQQLLPWAQPAGRGRKRYLSDTQEHVIAVLLHAACRNGASVAVRRALRLVQVAANGLGVRLRGEGISYHYFYSFLTRHRSILAVRDGLVGHVDRGVPEAEIDACLRQHATVMAGLTAAMSEPMSQR